MAERPQPCALRLACYISGAGLGYGGSQAGRDQRYWFATTTAVASLQRCSVVIGLHAGASPCSRCPRTVLQRWTLTASSRGGESVRSL